MDEELLLLLGGAFVVWYVFMQVRHTQIVNTVGGQI